MVIYEIVCREVPFEEEEPGDVGKYTLAGAPRRKRWCPVLC